MPRLLRLIQFQITEFSHGRRPPRPTPRQPSSRCTASILMTSAPRSAAISVASGPDMNIVRSRMRIPSSGPVGSLARSRGGAGAGDRRRASARTSASCSPGAGAGVVVVGVADIRNGMRGAT